MATEAFRMLETRTSRNASPASKPVTGVVNGFPYEAIDGYAVVEGDMVMGEVDDRGRLRARLRQRGLGLTSLYSRWSEGIVPFQFADNLSFSQIDKIESAIEHLSARTHLTFVERTDGNADEYSDFIEFQDGPGCASYVGKVGLRPQPVWVASVCPVGSVIHEISHAVGLFHEHTRPDRDQYVTINRQNIIDGKEPNFKIVESGITLYGEYDPESIMHYGRKFFSKNGDDTISAPAHLNIGQRRSLSAGDIAAIDQMYGTDLSLTVNSAASGQRAEVSFDVTNQGKMGAHSLVLELQLDDRTTWDLSGSTGDWDCTADGQALECRLPLLVPDEVSRFSVSTGNLDSREPSVAVRLDSATFDTNEENNSRDHALPKNIGTSNGNSNQAATGNTRQPVLAALQPDSGSSPNAFEPVPDEDSDTTTDTMRQGGGGSGTGDSDTDGADFGNNGGTPDNQPATSQRAGATVDTSSSGGGASHPVVGLALLTLLAWRRRKRREREQAGVRTS